VRTRAPANKQAGRKKHKGKKTRRGRKTKQEETREVKLKKDKAEMK
jgi:hypothetical protein